MQLIFSDAKEWEGDSAVIQMLVFPCIEAQMHFEKMYNDPNREKTASDYPNENGIGAMFKLRAVRNNRGCYDAVIRCGVSGAMVYERNTNTANPLDAIRFALNRLATSFEGACEAQLKKMMEPK
jgi:hypothetical protein